MAPLTKLLWILATSNIVCSSVLRTSPGSGRALGDDNETPLPVVIWHGLGDNYQADGLNEVASLVEEVNEGTFTYIIRLDEDASAE